MKNKYIYIGIGLLVLVGGGYFLMNSNKPVQNSNTEDVSPTPEELFPTISEDVKVELTSNSGQAVRLSISNIPSNVESVEYELIYMTGEGLPRGVTGNIKLEGKTEIERDDIVLGTCSSGKCVYDQGVISIDLSLKFNSQAGAKVFKKTYPL